MKLLFSVCVVLCFNLLAHNVFCTVFYYRCSNFLRHCYINAQNKLKHKPEYANVLESAVIVYGNPQLV